MVMVMVMVMGETGRKGKLSTDEIDGIVLWKMILALTYNDDT